MNVACIPCIPIRAFLETYSTFEAIELLVETEIILGLDSATQKAFLIHGRERYFEIIKDVDSEPVDVLMIEVDRQTDPLNQVLALVTLAKSCCDYAESK